MDTTRIARPARVHIQSNGKHAGTRVLIDGKDMGAEITAVTWTAQANSKPPTAVVTFHNVEIDAEADSTDPPPAETEVRAVDLAILDLKPGDTILIRSEQHLDDEAYDQIEKLCRRHLPGHKVVVLDGGLELSVLRQEDAADPMPSQRFATERDRESFLALFGDKLDTWFTPEFAAFVRKGPQPVVARGRVERGEPLDSEAPTYHTVPHPDLSDTVMPVLDQALRMDPATGAVMSEPSSPKRTPEQWCAHYGVEIHDPDGWRSDGDPAWDEPITLPDFRRRASRSTVRAVAAEGWRQVDRDAAAAEAGQ